MEQLPPKAPVAMPQNWPSFSFQVMPPLPTSAAAAHSSWVDDFLDFSTARRSAHRRTVSDPIAFVEAPPFLEETHSSNNTNNNNIGFEKLDDEQLRSMFSDDVETAGPASRSHSDPSTPSDQNSENEEKEMLPAEIHLRLQPKNEPGEEDNPCFQAQKEAPPGNNADPKRIKRILANRQSAQRSRVRKLQYISELERSVTTLQTEVSALSPKVAFLDHQRLLLNVDNSALKQRIAALAQDKIFKDAHQEALKKEIERLRIIYSEQSMKKMSNDSSGSAVPPHKAAAVPPQ
ncbi:basic leucine zipper 34-like [Henckelia pumila]|uniref:basic leucine zipper 34-like n=1 Tax=Henckelia pumila TaxID=405737 RepID=UPI003C6E0DF6